MNNIYLVMNKMKYFICCIAAIFVSIPIFSQNNEWDYNEHTKDVSYEAPVSKFTKKWYSRNKNNDGYYETLIMSPNGTYTNVMIITNDETGFVVPVKVTFSATWKRIERLTFLITYTNIKYTIDQSELAKIPARRRDNLKKVIAQREVSIKKRFVGRKDYCRILKVDDDHLIWSNGTRCEYWMTERLYKRKLDENVFSEKIEEENVNGKEINKEEDVFDVVEEMPRFPEGISALFEYVSKSIQYPEAAKMKEVQGRVIVTFIVEKDGSISNAKVVKSVEPSLDEEALRVVSTKPKWVPGKQGGETVRVKYTLPVTFRL